MRTVDQKLAVARGEKLAEIVFRNANLINVLSGEIYRDNVAVSDGRVVGLGDYEGEKIIDLDGSFLAPSFIDGHFHVESTMLTVPEFTRAATPHGTGAMVIDPHEFANVLGLDGIRYVLESSKNLPIDFFIMLPSCVPATHLESAGAKLTADDLALMISDERIAGIAELMNYPGVYLGLESELAKIRAGRGKAIDGHAPGLRGKNLNAYVLAGVRSDHESTELDEAREKLRLGMHLLIREGSTERNLEHIISLVTPQNAANCSFATDDKLAGDLVSEGHIDHSIRKAIRLGVPPVTAIQMGTINTARHYRLKNLGAIAPRFWADFVVFDDLQNLNIRQTYKKGILVAENGKYLAARPANLERPRSTMNLSFSPEQFRVPARGAKKIKVIELVPNKISTRPTTTFPKF
jgi:adenine deaminase